MTDVFISYKREDKARAKAIAEALARRGLHVWWDIDLLPGDQFTDEIENVINRARAAVVLWSKRSIRSRFVRDEAQIAADRGVLIPVRIDASKPPLGFRGLQTEDLSKWDGSSDSADLNRLIDSVAKRVGRDSKRDVSDTELHDHLHSADEEAAFWQSITSQPSPPRSEYQLYLERYPDGLFARIAQLRMETDGRSRRGRILAGVVTAAVLVIGAAALGPGLVNMFRSQPEHVLDDDTDKPVVSVEEDEVVPPPGMQNAVAKLASGILNVARSNPDQTPVYVDDVYEYYAGSGPIIREQNIRSSQLSIISRVFPPEFLSLPEIGYFKGALQFGVFLSDKMIEQTVNSFVLDYQRAAMGADAPLAGIESFAVPAPPLVRIGTHRNFYTKIPSQPALEITCERREEFIAFHVTYVEALLLYRSLVLRAYGNEDLLVDRFGVTGHAAGSSLDVGRGGAFQVDVLLSSRFLELLEPKIAAVLDRLETEWQARIREFARGMLAYRESYRILIDELGVREFERAFGEALPNVPNPFGCTKTDKQRLDITFGLDCGLGPNCDVIHYYETSYFAEVGYPGLHQGIISFWHRRALAGTEDLIVKILEPWTQLATGTEVDMIAIREAIAVGNLD